MAEHAAIPVANATARPPSSAPIAASNAAAPGCPSRAYPLGPPAWKADARVTGSLSAPSGVGAGRPAAIAMVSGCRLRGIRRC